MRETLLIFFSLYSTFLLGQQVVFSPFGENEKNEAKIVAETFIQKVKSKAFDSLNELFPSDEANINGDFYVPIEPYTQMLTDAFKQTAIENWSIEAWTFDEVISSLELRATTQQVYRVFNNFRILCTVAYTDRGVKKDGLIILENKGESWKICSIANFGLTSVIENDDSLTGENHRYESLDEIGVSIPVPMDFSERREASNQYFFDLKENDVQLAQFHVAYGPLQTDIELITFRFIQYAYKDLGQYSDLTIYLYPAGIFFDYWVTDANGGQNKGYTMGIANGDKAIFIQFNSTEAVYLNYWKDLDFTFRNIEKK